MSKQGLASNREGSYRLKGLVGHIDHYSNSHLCVTIDTLREDTVSCLID